jgi:hypothetical protein
MCVCVRACLCVHVCSVRARIHFATRTDIYVDMSMRVLTFCCHLFYVLSASVRNPHLEFDRSEKSPRAGCSDLEPVRAQLI